MRVEGWLRHCQSQNVEGQTRYRTAIVAGDVMFLDVRCAIDVEAMPEAESPKVVRPLAGVEE